MDAASRGSRLTPIRIGAALVVAGALSIGAAACGSGSSTDSTGSASVVKKEAGLFTLGTRIEVINNDQADIKVGFCEVNVKCIDPQMVSPGQSVAFAVDGRLYGRIDFPGQPGYPRSIPKGFYAVNPTVGEPSIGLCYDPNVVTGGSGEPRDDGRDPDPFNPDPADCKINYMVEGEVQDFTRYYRSWTFERQGDSGDYKEMRLKVGKSTLD